MRSNHPLYVLFAILTLFIIAAADVRGWSLTQTTEVKNVPRTVRDNPGSYRPHYHYYGGGGYMRGK